MNGKTYAYLDYAGLPVVGDVLLDPRPAWLFSADGAGILWANAAGARLFGAENMGSLLERRIGATNPIVKQLARFARTLPAAVPRMEILRLSVGLSLSALPAACQRIILPGGQSAVLAVAAGDKANGSIVSRAEELADMIAGPDCLVAVIAADGRVVGASGNFNDLAPASVAIDGLVNSVCGGEDRIAKRSFKIAGTTRPAGGARFDVGGDAYALLIVGPGGPDEDIDDLPAPEDMPAPVVEPGRPVAPSQPLIRLVPAVPPPAMHTPSDTAPPPPKAIRFLWQVDQGQHFTFVSGELGRNVGNAMSDLIGMTWRDVSQRLGIDREGKIQAALDTRGQWAGIKVYWPVDGSDNRIAAELSAFPVAERGVFSGHRGLGILRPDDCRRETPPVTGSGTTVPESARDKPIETGLPIDRPTVQIEPPTDPGDVDDAARKSVEQGVSANASGGLSTAELPAADDPAKNSDSSAEPSNVVQLPGSKPMRQSETTRLSGSEQDAFRRIAETLGVKRAKTEKPEKRDTSGKKEKPPTPPAEPASPAPDVGIDILNRIPVGVVIYRGDETLFANRTLLDLLDYEDLAAFAKSGGADTHFSDRSPDTAKSRSDEAKDQFSARRKDGSLIPVEARLRSVTWTDGPALLLAIRGRTPEPEVAPLHDDLIRDISAVEARLEELEAILDTATDGVVVVDSQGTICNFNRSAEALFGAEASDVLGTPFADLLAEESRKPALDYLDGLASNGVASVLNDGREVIGKVPQGGLIPMFMTMGRLGRTDKYCAVLRDITHWKNAEEELVAARRAAETANAQKSEFLAKISHEIRTPLNAIIGFSEVMMEERFGPIGNARYRDYLRDIHVSGSHLLSLINDLLDLSKIEAGKLELSFESVAVNESIQECVALMQPQANRERIIIRTSLAAGVPNVVADPRSFRQILFNLLSNAVKFTKAGGQVIVSTGIEDDGEVVVRIRDTGVGMSEKDVETALKPFRQLATSGRARSEGSGLGLPLTKALVEANRAAFSIDSELNQGTLVKITFPTTRVLAG